MSTHNEVKKGRTWFSRGVEAFSHLGLDLPDYYVCPLCINGFSEELIGRLTLEHVPPKSVGGSRLVLTCDRCNSEGGGKVGVDTHASTVEKLRKFREGTLGYPLRGKLHVDSLSLNVSIERRDEGLSISGLEKQNPPGACNRLKQILDEYVNTKKRDWKLHLSFPTIKYSMSHQRVSWLRAAYLAAFAALGYRYAFRPVLNMVRDQIRNPGEDVISFFHFVRQEAPSPSQFLMLVRSPQWAKGVLVNMGRHYVMLPFLDNDSDFYERLAIGSKKNLQTRLDGLVIDWPKEPKHLFDFSPVSDVNALVEKIEGRN